jgi:uncharacterized protein
MKLHIYGAIMGIVLGVVLTATGFVDYGEVHRMFVFKDLRLWLTFCGAVGLSAVGFFVLARKAGLPKRSVHKATIIGAVIFGVGWAVTGACPAVTLVQLGNGYIPALATLGGVIVGALACGWARRRFAWEADSCDE